MRRIIGALIMIVALSAAYWYSHNAAPGRVDGISIDLPVEPKAWRGRVDYSALDRQLAILSERPEMAGLAVAVVEDGTLRFVRSYGVVDRATGVKVTPDTLFRWASVSKTVTGTLAATLAEAGAINLERPVSDWQTSLRLPGGAETRLTLAQLLSHQTGLTKNAFDDKLEAGESPDALRRSLVSAPLQCPPGTCHTYQNIAFDAASEIVTQSAGKRLEDAVSERFFGPLGMASAGYGMARLTASQNWARPHATDRVLPLREAYWRVPAAAGIESNIIDFARWMQASMGVRAEVVRSSALRLAQSPRVDTPRLYSGALAQALSDPRYGLGWRSFHYAGHALVGHSGAVDGYRATLIFEPTTRTGVVAMWNSNWGIPFRIPFAVLDSYHKQPGARWLDLSDIPLPSAEPAP
jgi:beta-lactamase class C